MVNLPYLYPRPIRNSGCPRAIEKKWLVKLCLTHPDWNFWLWPCALTFVTWIKTFEWLTAKCGCAPGSATKPNYDRTPLRLWLNPISDVTPLSQNSVIETMKVASHFCDRVYENEISRPMLPVATCHIYRMQSLSTTRKVLQTCPGTAMSDLLVIAITGWFC